MKNLPYIIRNAKKVQNCPNYYIIALKLTNTFLHIDKVTKNFPNLVTLEKRQRSETIDESREKGRNNE